MYVHQLELDKRAEGGGLVTSEGDSAISTGIGRGWTVTLSYQEIRFIALVYDVEPDHSFIGQITTFDGYLEPNIEGLRIGSYLRFREEHILACDTA